MTQSELKKLIKECILESQFADAKREDLDHYLGTAESIAKDWEQKQLIQRLVEDAYNAGYRVGSKESK